MKRLLLATLLALAAPVVVWPQANTSNFSGAWKYEASPGASVRVGALNGGATPNGTADADTRHRPDRDRDHIGSGTRRTKWVYRLDGADRWSGTDNTEPGGQSHSNEGTVGRRKAGAVPRGRA